MGRILTKEELKSLEDYYLDTYEEIDKLKTQLFEINKQVVESIIAEAESRFIPLEVHEGFYDGFAVSTFPDRILHYANADKFTYLHLSQIKKDGTASKIHDDFNICRIVSIEKVEE